MVPSGPSTPIGGAQSVSPSLLRSNSGMMGAQGGLPSQSAFPSLVSPRTQFNSMNMLGNMPSMSSLLNQSFGNGVPNSGPPGLGNSQRGGMDPSSESDPFSLVGNGVNFNNTSASLVASNTANPGSSSQVSGPQFSNHSSSQIIPNQQQQPQQIEPQNFQHSQHSMQQFTTSNNAQQSQQQQQQQQQHQFQPIRGNLCGVGPVKLEPQMSTNDLQGQQLQQQQQQQLQSMRNLGPVKLEPQQLQSMRNLGPVKLEPQQSDQSLFLQQQQQQQQQQLLSMSRQSSQAAAAQINLLHQQRLLQFQQHQQLLKAMPQQRPHLPQQFQQQNVPLRSPVKPVYEPGMCARRLTSYMYQQQHRPEVRLCFLIVSFGCSTTYNVS